MLADRAAPDAEVSSYLAKGEARFVHLGGARYLVRGEPVLMSARLAGVLVVGALLEGGVLSAL